MANISDKIPTKDIVARLRGQEQRIAQLAVDPELEQSARSELIQRLRDRVQNPNIDLSPIFQWADSELGTKLAEGSQQPSPEEDLMTIVALEEQEKDRMAKLAMQQASIMGKAIQREETSKERRRTKDEALFSRFMQQMAITGRGTTYARNLKEGIDQSDIALNRIRDIKSGKLVGDYQTAVDISNAVSRLIAGGQPAITLVDATLYKSLGGDSAKIQQWITGNPEEYINSTQLSQIEEQLNNIKDTKSLQYQNWKDELQGSIGFVLDRNEDLKSEFETLHPRIKSEPKRSVPKSIKVVSPEGIEGTIPAEDLEQALAEGFKEIK